MYRLGKQGLVLFRCAACERRSYHFLFMYFEAFLISDWARYWAIMIPITAVWLLSNYFSVFTDGLGATHPSTRFLLSLVLRPWVV